MATTYTSTIEVNVWKEHACVGCGERYRYLFRRKKTGQGGSPAAASKAAHSAVVRAIANEVDQQPCPGCGLYQPDMVGARRASAHWRVFWVFLVLWAVVLILGLTEVMTGSSAAWAAAGVGLGCFLIHLTIDSINPNSNLDANRHRAVSRVEDGTIVLGDKESASDEQPASSGRSGRRWLVALLYAIAVFAMASPELLRSLKGWPANPKWVPQYAGPGDHPYCYLDGTVRSVKGYWNGHVTAQVTNARELGLASDRLRGTTKTSNWGAEISGKSVSSETSTLWTRLEIPNVADLAGKTLKLNVAIAYTFPEERGAKQFVNSSANYSQPVELMLGPVGSGGQFRTLWGLGMAGGGVLALLCGASFAQLAWGLRKQARSTSILSPEVPDEI